MHTRTGYQIEPGHVLTDLRSQVENYGIVLHDGRRAAWRNEYNKMLYMVDIVEGDTDPNNLNQISDHDTMFATPENIPYMFPDPVA
jgi:hypothetical protein